MESLIRLKVKLDLLTHRISKYAERKYIKFTLKVIYWFVVAFIAYDFYKYGVSTGNSILLSTFITILLIKHMKKRVVEKNGDQLTNIRPTKEKAGNKGYCEKCGIKVNINYGDAYRTLCQNCA